MSDCSLPDSLTINPEIEAYSDIDGKVRRQTEKGIKLYWVGCGDTDVFKLYPKSEAFAEKMQSYGVPTIFHGSDKGHVWSNWRQYLLDFAPRLFK